MSKPVKTVYLAGPITGLSYQDARGGWRGEFVSLLPEHILCVSPMRGKECLSNEKILQGHAKMYDDNILANASGIVSSDRYDVMNCDAVVANFLGASIVSIGTCIEFGWADAFRKPIIMLHDENDLHDHAMLNEMAGYVTDDIAAAAAALTRLLTPGL